jgi:molybdate transport system substrate-binding protein
VKSMTLLRAALAGALVGLFALPALAADAGSVTVFAAASLSDVLPVIEKQYEATGGGKVNLVFAASGTLARQIESSSGADIFISADNAWMDYLSKRGFIQDDTRKAVLGNRLVLVAPAAATANLTIAPHFPLLAALNGSHLAIGDPDTVPAGVYARSALTTLGVWDGVVSHIAYAENVRVALEYVARGEATYGIVYETDAKAEPRVHVAGIFPENSHLPILYPFALTKDAKAGAAKFLDYSEGPQARAVYEKAGFSVLNGGK